MENNRTDRRGFLGKLVAVVGGLAAVPMLSRPALAGRSHWRGWGGYGYGMRRSGIRPGYGGYGGIGGYGNGFYNRGFNVSPYGGGIYSPGFGGYGGYPGYGGYGGYGVGIPILKRDDRRAIDVLSLLES